MQNLFRRQVRTLSVALLAASATTPAFAGTVVCAGTVTELTYTMEGGSFDPIVLLRLSSMNTPVKVCSLSQNWTIGVFTTTPTACKALYGAMLAARLSGNAVNDVYFDFSGSSPSTCTGWSYTPTQQQASVRNYRL